jgi:intracellular sulfur oxidation DsrE/DsrF family protein
MKDDAHFTDNDLHRYIDGELDPKARDELQDQLQQNPTLAQRVRAYQSVNDALREAFDTVESPTGRMENQPVRLTRSSIAAAVLLLPAGFLAGWLGHSLLTGSEIHEPLTAGINLPVQGQEHLNTVFHIDVDERSVVNGLLDRTEAILAAYADLDVQVEVVANAGGLNLLRADTSAFAPRVREMMDTYENLTFVACANTIERLRERGVDVHLIDRTHARSTAIDHVISRLRDGWTYIKI